jgi:hypothetical protein
MAPVTHHRLRQSHESSVDADCGAEAQGVTPAAKAKNARPERFEHARFRRAVAARLASFDPSFGALARPAALTSHRVKTSPLAGQAPQRVVGAPDRVRGGFDVGYARDHGMEQRFRFQPRHHLTDAAVNSGPER